MHSSRSPRSARIRRRAPLLALALIACLAGVAHADTWAPTGSMSTTRAQHTATLLPNGQVLVAGGLNGSGVTAPVDTSERYDPATGQWLRSPSFADARYEQGASMLPDGRVLMTGGYYSHFTDPQVVYDSALAFDPATNAWRRVATMPHPHGYHAQVTLLDGRVLVFGGFSSVDDRRSDGADDQVELYDPRTNAWTIGADAPYFMADGTTTLLNDGSVLVAGGSSSNARRNVAMRYFPATNRWRAAGSFNDARRNQVAALLPDGRVLIAGGEGDGGRALGSASVYDPATNRWSDVAPMATARYGATATLVPNGKVLVTGGLSLASTELFDPTTNTWAPGAPMQTSRNGHTATLLQDGRVLVGGGRTPLDDLFTTSTASAEIYTPDGWPFRSGGGSGGGGGGGGTGGGGSGGGGGTPSLSRLALSATRFRAAGSGPSVTAARRRRRAPVGTTISYRDGAAATATFVVQRPATGRKSGGRCARPTRANRRKAHCTRWIGVGRFAHADKAGLNTLPFTGRVAGRKLSPGRYRLSITARTGAGRPSAARTIGFQIVR